MNNNNTVVGNRELYLANGGKVIVSLWTPTLNADAEDEFFCFYCIEGLQVKESGRVIGSDALQALQLALVKVGIILYSSEEWKNNFLFWNGERELGFPLPKSLEDLRR